MNTIDQYNKAIRACQDIFIKKTKDYGTSWRVLRMISIVDQIFIKAQRIRTIQEKQVQKVADDVKGEFIGIVNYGIIALIQQQKGSYCVEEIALEEATMLYNYQIEQTRKLMQDKNHDYGEAWRDMSQQSFVDLILVKLLRVKQIILNDGKTLISEGIDANYADIINYALFALIKIEEEKS